MRQLNKPSDTLFYLPSCRRKLEVLNKSIWANILSVRVPPNQ